VQENFERYGLRDSQVEFLKGWFKDTLPALRDRTFAVIRLDGDMYQSTIEALENLYDRVSPGGFVIIDDYGAIPACKQAVEDFRDARGIEVALNWVDWTGVWWRKPR
jgi:O-methyltransferase